MKFFIGLHKVSHAKRLGIPACISVNTLRVRKGDFEAGDWLLDSGAFSTILQHGGYPQPVQEYAQQIERWSRCGNLLAAVAQDFMCEPSMIARTGLSVAEHQRLTIERYEELVDCALPVYLMPVLQGYLARDYVAHIEQYGARLPPRAWVGVGSVCRRNGTPFAVFKVLEAIKRRRPDLRLHGFGLKRTALANAGVRGLLESADSMAWSFAARYEGGNPNGWQDAAAFAAAIERAGLEQAQAASAQRNLF